MLVSAPDLTVGQVRIAFETTGRCWHRSRVVFLTGPRRALRLVMARTTHPLYVVHFESDYRPRIPWDPAGEIPELAYTLHHRGSEWPLLAGMPSPFCLGAGDRFTASIPPQPRGEGCLHVVLELDPPG